jgi:hypothetical protein
MSSSACSVPKDDARVLKDMSVRRRTPKDAKALVMSAILPLMASPGTLEPLLPLPMAVDAAGLMGAVAVVPATDADLFSMEDSHGTGAGWVPANGSSKTISSDSVLPLGAVETATVVDSLLGASEAEAKGGGPGGEGAGS